MYVMTATEWKSLQYECSQKPRDSSCKDNLSITRAFVDFALSIRISNLSGQFVCLQKENNSPMKHFFRILFLVVLVSSTSCKKCYECTCIDDTTLGGCTQLGQQQEICDKGLVGKSFLTIRKLELEAEGYSCNLK